MPRVRKKLDRQIKRYLSDKNDFLEDIKALKEHLNHTPNIPDHYIKIISNFPSFFSSVTNTYDQYEDKAKMALHNLNLSSKELNSLNKQLESLNASLNIILESLGSALLFFNEEGICSPVHSKSCSIILGVEPDNMHIWDILKMNTKEKEEFKSLIKFCFSNESAMTFEDIFGMASQNIISQKGKYITIEYRPIYAASGRLSNILAIADDKTHENEIKLRLKEKEKQSEKVMRTAFATKDYKRIISQTKEYFLSQKPKYEKEESIANIATEIHTLKGLTSSFHIHGLTDLFHKLEYEILGTDIDLEKAKQKIKNAVPSINSCVKTEIENVETLFGKEFIRDKEFIDVEKKELIEFYTLVKNDKKLADLFYKKFLTTPIFKKLKSLDLHAQQTADDLNKELHPIIFKGDNFLIPTNGYDELIDSFVHLIRNAIDHSIENPEERVEAGKPPQGSLYIKTKTYDINETKWAQIMFSDDGKGIDTNAIKKSLKNKGIETKNMDENAIVQTILNEKLTSKDTVTKTSGRGIGLDAVKNKVEALGGHIAIKHKKETIFIISFPISKN